jgi:hypothetical protein
VSGAALEPIAAAAAVDPVVAVAAPDVVVAGAAADHVVAVAAVDDVVAVTAVDHVVAVAALDAVMAVAAVENVVAVATMDEVVAVPAEDAGPTGPAGAELVVAGTTDDPLAGNQSDDEVHPTAHTRQARPHDRGHPRVSTQPRAGIEPYQPGREPVPARARPSRTHHHRADGPHTGHHCQHPNHGPCPARESNREHPSPATTAATPTAPTLPDNHSLSEPAHHHSVSTDNAEIAASAVL